VGRLTTVLVADRERDLAEFKELAERRRVAAYEEFFSPTTDPCGRWLLDRIARPGNGRAVDVGCGPGTLLKELERRGWQALGVDLTESMLRRARARGSAANLILADAAALPLPDGVVQLVLMAFVAPHLADPDRAYREARRVLGPGGFLACATWRESHRSPFTGLAFEVIRRCCRLSAEALALLDELDDRARRLPAATADAGLTPRMVRHVDGERRFGDAEAWWRGLVAASIGLTGVLQPLSPRERRHVRAEFCAAAEAFRTGEGLRVPVAVTLLIAERT
jgi:SAM-dependent methyltransferase